MLIAPQGPPVHWLSIAYFDLAPRWSLGGTGGGKAVDVVFFDIFGFYSGRWGPEAPKPI